MHLVPLAPTAEPPWRLHPSARLALRPVPAIALGGRRWALRGLTPGVTAWLLSASRGGAVAPDLSGPDLQQWRTVSSWLRSVGLLQRPDIDGLLLFEQSSSHMGRVLAGSARVEHRSLTGSGALPTTAELTSEERLVVARSARLDRAMGWLLQATRTDHVLVEATPEQCRVGVFTGGTCLHCDDLARGENRPLRALPAASGSGRPGRDEPLPVWMDDWAAAQVMVTWQRWRSAGPLPPQWWWLRADGSTGQAQVRPHPLCCGGGRALAG